MNYDNSNTEAVSKMESRQECLFRE